MSTNEATIDVMEWIDEDMVIIPEETGRKKKVKEPLPMRRCKACGAEFRPVTTTQYFCKDEECKLQRNREAGRKHREEHKDKEEERKRKKREYMKRVRMLRAAEKDKETKETMSDMIAKLEAQERAFNEHGHEWGRVKAEKTLAKVSPIKLTL